MMEIGNSIIYVNDNHIYVGDYYHYILSILKHVIERNNLSININLNGSEYNFNNDNNTLKININFEHTLVKKGGRSVPHGTPVGKINYDTFFRRIRKKYKYFVRIENFEKLNSGDIVIDYSLPNIYNVKESNLFNDFANKHIYISPCIYENIYITSKNRDIQSLTTFINTNEPRRKKLLENISISKLNHSNMNNCFDKKEIQSLYQNTKILINIHQTPHHDTFEELRCLPALQNGVIVVSEKSPLIHLIPYKDLIVWCDYDEIIQKRNEILENYDEYYNKIFSEKNINLLRKMDEENKKCMENKILNLSKSTNRYIYIHVCCLNNYVEIFMHLVNLIKNSGLYDNVLEIRCCVLGNKSDDFDEIIRKDNKIKIIKEDSNLSLYESFTINQLIDDSKTEKSHILYLHTKGCTHTKNSQYYKGIKSWVEYMSYFNITKWKMCDSYLENYDMVGVNLQDRKGEECHYAGNFWWINSEYSKHMNKCKQENYNSPEFHMTKDGMGKFLGLWHSECPHYTQIYPEKLYVDKKINPYEITASRKKLDYLAKKYTLDKISTHNYTPGYEKLFKNIRYKTKNVLEIGIGSVENNQMQHVAPKGYKTGNSLKCWEEYFANSSIYGIDIFPHPELDKDRIKTFVADQSSEQQLESVIKKISSPLDIIIDDGSHFGEHQVFSFMYLNKYLAPDGIYVIEDIQPPNIEGFKDLSIFPEGFKEYINKNFTVEFFDTRNSCNRFRADDFMISFTKK